ncbi:F-box protein At4g00755-like [Papaver somniferum]|uniref:F-box protein At4g00755-like n=1 Tax=Papaver somniferum TaxID=3469 RepID=UPI000E701C20|nr:F-box protein At4g00755-like [Papaver somniferum]
MTDLQQRQKQPTTIYCANSIDFVVLLNSDLSFKILSNLNNTADVVRASSVSRFWRQFVIASGFSKSLCLRLYPETLSSVKAIEENNVIQSMGFETRGGGSVGVEKLKKNHRIYAVLARSLAHSLTKECILEAICESSNRSTAENIQQTLIPAVLFNGRFSYWSSPGKTNPEVPETLTYRLVSKLCFISEIHIEPFQGYYVMFMLSWCIVIYVFSEHNLYSSKAVRFRMGHVKEPQRERYLTSDYGAGKSIEDHVVWTYTSKKFPMRQDGYLQKFKLPEPVLAIGGLLQIELLGRVQLGVNNGLYHLRTIKKELHVTIGDGATRYYKKFGTPSIPSAILWSTWA